MIHYKEVDHRSTALRTVCTSMENSISELAGFAKNGLLDGITAMEYATYLQGAALVACQAYAVGCVSDINDIRKSRGQQSFGKLALYKEGRWSPDNYGQIELINSLANYFKHNEEWDRWPNNETVRALRHFGIDEETDFPINYGINCILGESDDLRKLCNVLETWRYKLIEGYR